MIFNLPRCVIRDFDEVLHPNEKIGGAIFPIEKTHCLKKFVHDIDAISLSRLGVNTHGKTILKDC